MIFAAPGDLNSRMSLIASDFNDGLSYQEFIEIFWFSLALRSERFKRERENCNYDLLYFCPFALYRSLITTRVDVRRCFWIFQKDSFVLQRRDNHLHSQHPDVSSGRLCNLFDTGSHRPGTANAGVRGRQERTWSRVPHVSRGRSQATGRFLVGHYILHYAARKKFLFRWRNRPRSIYTC